MATINIYDFYDRVRLGIREPVSTTPDGQGGYTFVFEPPLTAAEQTALDDLTTMAKFGINHNMTLAEFQAMKPDLALGKTFLGIGTPTQAQAVAAEKAIIRVIGALLRE